MFIIVCKCVMQNTVVVKTLGSTNTNNNSHPECHLLFSTRGSCCQHFGVSILKKKNPYLCIESGSTICCSRVTGTFNLGSSLRPELAFFWLVSQYSIMWMYPYFTHPSPACPPESLGCFPFAIGNLAKANSLVPCSSVPYRCY